jgi:hypothetical protein
VTAATAEAIGGKRQPEAVSWTGSGLVPEDRWSSPFMLAWYTPRCCKAPWVGQDGGGVASAGLTLAFGFGA